MKKQPSDKPEPKILYASAKEKCWLTKDKTKLVKDGHEDAAHLFAGEGTEVKPEALEGVENAADFLTIVRAVAE